MKPVVKKRRLYFTMVHHPINGRIRVGSACAAVSDARYWLPIVRRAWRGLRVTMAQCTLVWHDGVLTAKSVETLDRQFNMLPPGETP